MESIETTCRGTFFWEISCFRRLSVGRATDLRPFVFSLSLSDLPLLHPDESRRHALCSTSRYNMPYILPVGKAWPAVLVPYVSSCTWWVEHALYSGAGKACSPAGRENSVCRRLWQIVHSHPWTDHRSIPACWADRVLICTGYRV